MCFRGNSPQALPLPEVFSPYIQHRTFVIIHEFHHLCTLCKSTLKVMIISRKCSIGYFVSHFVPVIFVHFLLLLRLAMLFSPVQDRSDIAVIVTVQSCYHALKMLSHARFIALFNKLFCHYQRGPPYGYLTRNNATICGFD